MLQWRECHSKEAAHAYAEGIRDALSHNTETHIREFEGVYYVAWQDGDLPHDEFKTVPPWESPLKGCLTPAGLAGLVSENVYDVMAYITKSGDWEPPAKYSRDAVAAFLSTAIFGAYGAYGSSDATPVRDEEEASEAILQASKVIQQGIDELIKARDYIQSIA